MKLKRFLKSKKGIVLSILALCCVATAFGSYVFRENPTVLQQEARNLQSGVSANIDIDQPGSEIESVDPNTFLTMVSSPSSRQAANTPQPQYQLGERENNSRSSFGNSTNTTLLADNSGQIFLSSNSTNNPTGEDIPEPYTVEPGTFGNPSNSESNSEPIMLLAGSTISPDKDIMAGNGSSIRVSKASVPGETSDNSDQDTSHVPEPSTMILLGTGLVSLAVWGRKRLLR